jgi:hypothetical protein
MGLPPGRFMGWGALEERDARASQTALRPCVAAQEAAIRLDHGGEKRGTTEERLPYFFECSSRSISLTKERLSSIVITAVASKISSKRP